MEYAHDISKVTSNHSSMENFKHNTSEILKPKDLNVNHYKTEQYTINKTNNEWRLCKYLGSMLDTAGLQIICQNLSDIMSGRNEIPSDIYENLSDINFYKNFIKS